MNWVLNWLARRWGRLPRMRRYRLGVFDEGALRRRVLRRSRKKLLAEAQDGR